jgi:hypothetical protein
MNRKVPAKQTYLLTCGLISLVLVLVSCGVLDSNSPGATHLNLSVEPVTQRYTINVDRLYTTETTSRSNFINYYDYWLTNASTDSLTPKAPLQKGFLR